MRPMIQDRRGIATLEMALLAPFLMLLLLAAFELGSAIEQSLRLETAARAGALHAAALPTDMAGIEATVRAALDGWTNVTVTPPALLCECPGSGTIECGGTCASAIERFVTIQATRPFSGVLLTNFPTLTGHVVQRIQ